MTDRNIIKLINLNVILFWYQGAGHLPFTYYHTEEFDQFWDSVNLCFLPNEIQEPITVTGSASGIWNTDECVKSGVAAGLKAAQSLGVKTINYSFPKPGDGPILLAPYMKLVIIKIIPKFC